MREQMDNAGDEQRAPTACVSSVPGQGQKQVHTLQHSLLSPNPPHPHTHTCHSASLSAKRISNLLIQLTAGYALRMLSTHRRYSWVGGGEGVAHPTQYSKQFSLNSYEYICRKNLRE